MGDELISVENIKGDKVRFLIMGVLTNLFAFCLYIVLVSIGASPKKTLTFLYWISVVLIFFANRTFVFGHKGSIFHAFKRHILVYISGYILSISMLTLFIDFIDFDHIFSMAATSLIMPIYFYTMQKHLVFR